MKTFWVSLGGLLAGVYIEFSCESEKRVTEWLNEKYNKNGVWTLPWCSIYTKYPAGFAKYVVKGGSIQ